MHRRLLPSFAALACLLAAVPATLAQQGPDGPPPGEDRRRDWNPEQMRERQMERLREQMEASDEEWDALAPKIEKVMIAAQDAMPGGGMMGRGGRGGGPGGPGGGDGAQENESAVVKAQRELRETLRNDDGDAARIAEKVKALRDARAKAQADLAAARAELKKDLAPRHEAVLVMIGMID